MLATGLILIFKGKFFLGQRHFGESYWQEAEQKMAELADLDIVWHFIGPIQSNKTRPIAEHFHWVHSVDREKVARRLSEQRPPGLPPLKVCLQVNIDREDSKSGVQPEQVLPLAQAVASLPNLARGELRLPLAARKPVWASSSAVKKAVLLFVRSQAIHWIQLLALSPCRRRMQTRMSAR